MKALENRTIDSKREMDILDALDEIRTRNARNERVDADALLDKLLESDQIIEKSEKEKEDEEDDMLAKAIFNTVDGDKVKRVIDDEPELSQLLSESAKSFVIPKFNSTGSTSNSKGIESNKRKNLGSELGIVIKKKKTENNNSLGSLLGDYGSSEDSE
ncbi:12542_t:CDS:1 [Dentiscutata erythropus]|uniref:12542_t:CDS:1 n=1 Tax=Dentiscutata erythropus TaxID=1348616 RepID=A0A9N9GWW3_9GLOM|nr:12542_t:CDS:1 [Dentiscutata erythropus]